MSENKEKIVVNDIRIIVRGIENRPYYEIEYRKVGSDNYNIGFGSYNLNNVLKWKEEKFEIVSKSGTKKEVINEMMIEHLRALEKGQSLMLNGMLTIFQIIDDCKDDIKLDEEMKEVIKSGKVAMMVTIKELDRMSGVSKKIEEQEKETRYELLKLFGLL